MPQGAHSSKVARGEMMTTHSVLYLLLTQEPMSVDLGQVGVVRVLRPLRPHDGVRDEYSARVVGSGTKS